LSLLVLQHASPPLYYRVAKIFSPAAERSPIHEDFEKTESLSRLLKSIAGLQACEQAGSDAEIFSLGFNLVEALALLKTISWSLKFGHLSKFAREI
jgi:hypothetical protein